MNLCYPAINFYTGNCDDPHALKFLANLPIRLLMRSLVMTAALLLVLPATAQAAEGDIIVQRAPGLDRAKRVDLRQDAGVQLVQTLPLARTELVSAEDPDQALAALRADDDVVYAEPDREMQASRVMDDPFFGSLWGL
jgi:hypothetical protein